MEAGTALRQSSQSTLEPGWHECHQCHDRVCAAPVHCGKSYQQDSRLGIVKVTFYIQIMTRTQGAAGFRRYLASPPGSDPWSIAVPAGGRQVVRPGCSYPPDGHPADHHFRWETGRVLGSCQVVFISAGRGQFESRETGLRKVPAGSAILILPRVWHRYAPDPATGWTERWIELRGGIIDSLCARRTLDPGRAVIRIEDPEGMGTLIDAVHARLNRKLASASDPIRAALGLQVLAAVTQGAGTSAASRDITAKVVRGEQLLSETASRPPAMPQIARELGVAYSYFRREFKRHTGLSPYRYVQELRLEKARRLIGSSGESLQAIAEELGFASAFHLSAAFKKRFGQSPAHWRRGC
ncbi:MAG: AraC family transcriptional regulator [Opitutus sp.]